MTKLFNFDELREGLYRRFKDDDVFELRLMGAVTKDDNTRRNYSGYFSVVDFDAIQNHLLSIKNYEHLWGSNAQLKEETRKFGVIGREASVLFFVCVGVLFCAPHIAMGVFLT